MVPLKAWIPHENLSVALWRMSRAWINVQAEHIPIMIFWTIKHWLVTQPMGRIIAYMKWKIKNV
jgi:hypothetical protein